MLSLTDTIPDKVELNIGGDYWFIYGVVNTISMLPIGSEYSIVYSPSKYHPRWHVIGYKKIRSRLHNSNVAQIVFDRELKPDEIAYFEKLLKVYQIQFAEFAEAYKKGAMAVTIRCKPDSPSQANRRRYESLYWLVIRFLRRLFSVYPRQSAQTSAKYRRVINQTCPSMKLPQHAYTQSTH